MPLAEVLVYLGPFVVDSAWQLEIEEWLGGGDLGAIPPEARLSTLDLLALIPPSVQVVDGVFTAWAGLVRVVVVEAFDSTSWDITSTDERILTALADRCPDAHDLPT